MRPPSLPNLKQGPGRQNLSFTCGGLADTQNCYALPCIFLRKSCHGREITIVRQARHVAWRLDICQCGLLQVTMLRHKVYVDPHGNEAAVEVDAACIVSLPSKKVAYIAQVEHAATTSNLLATRDKWDTIRWVL